MWDLIVSGPDLCLSFYFAETMLVYNLPLGARGGLRSLYLALPRVLLIEPAHAIMVLSILRKLIL